MNNMQIEAYLRDMRELLRSKGWQELLKDIEEQLDMLNEVSSLNKIEDLWYRKGQIDVLIRLTNLEFELEALEEELESTE
mgnify:CR=1 FL=1